MFTWIEKKSKNTLRVGAFYRPPNQIHLLDAEILKELDLGITQRTIILGDFNLPKCFDSSATLDSVRQTFKDSFDEIFYHN